MNHKVLFNGDGSMLFRFEGLGDMVPIAEFEKLTSDRDSALAQNAELVAHAALCKKAFDDLSGHCLSNGVFNAWNQAMDCTSLNAAMSSTSTQHLRDRDAEAVLSAVEFFKPARDVDVEALVSYAEKVRRGE